MSTLKSLSVSEIIPNVLTMTIDRSFLLLLLLVWCGVWPLKVERLYDEVQFISQISPVNWLVPK